MEALHRGWLCTDTDQIIQHILIVFKRMKEHLHGQFKILIFVLFETRHLVELYVSPLYVRLYTSSPDKDISKGIDTKRQWNRMYKENWGPGLILSRKTYDQANQYNHGRDQCHEIGTKDTASKTHVKLSDMTQHKPVAQHAYKNKQRI